MKRAQFKYQGYLFRMKETSYNEFMYELTMYDEIETKLLGLFTFKRKVIRERGVFDANEWEYDFVAMANQLIHDYAVANRAEVKRKHLEAQGTARFEAIVDIERKK
ncbi:hypothetical protein [Paludifilum halophilum]|uniref:Uncharacterized protein n=1 Tax=Paludifilum halophilum TaxID=1642702 RepID=A0A235B8B4_9BACL|nr:hypothetical protein [Paludifilum halophilum]OYD08526.1 hypothetical protein CHM34_06785 [Paludifilum halophilum]